MIAFTLTVGRNFSELLSTSVVFVYLALFTLVLKTEYSLRLGHCTSPPDKKVNYVASPLLP